MSDTMIAGCQLDIWLFNEYIGISGLCTCPRDYGAGLLQWQKNLRGMYQIQNVFLAIVPIPLSLFVQTTDTDPRASFTQKGSEQLA